MFYELSRRIYSHFLIRNIHSSMRCQWRRQRPYRNPGIDYHQNEFKDSLSMTDLSNEFEIESDFMNVIQTHKELDKKEQKDRQKLRNQIVKQKYFKEQRLPNLLTFAEKEQVRMLHTLDPEEWTVDRLAESFPATSEIIRKILKSNWQPYKPQRIQKHDKVVMENWYNILNNNGYSYLPPHLKEHIIKFAKRKTSDLRNRKVEPNELSKSRKDGEFLSLITRCSQNSEKTEIEEKSTLHLNNPFKHKEDLFDKNSETYLLSNIENSQVMRLEDVKISNLMPKVLKSYSSVDSNKNKENLLSSNNHLITMDFIEKFESTAIEILPDDRKRFEIHQNKVRIHIPRNMYKNNATYRVKDCYYHSDGELLYRVPGMDGENH